MLASPGMAKLTGYSHEELLRLRVDDIHPTEELPDVLEKFYGLVEGRIATARDVPLLRKDRRIVYCDVSYGSSRQGDRDILYAFFRDVSERRTAEQRFRLAAQLASDLIYEWHVQDDTLLWFGGIEEALGYEPGEISPTLEGWLNLVHPDDATRLARTVEQQRGAVESVAYEYRVRRKDGSWRYWLDSGTPELDENGDAAKWIGVCTDITDRKRSEEERQAHLLFLQNMDKIDRCIRRADSLELMMKDVLNAVLEIYQCDRAWLLYPCDPDAPSFRVPMECTRPEYPGAGSLDTDSRMTFGTADACRKALASEGPLRVEPGAPELLDPVVARDLLIKSVMTTTLQPKMDKPWLFGIHQCSYGRVWTDEEVSLFQEIGRRITDALNSWIFLRNLRESEEKYRTLFEESKDAIYIVKPGGEMIDANPASSELFGATEDELVGANVHHFCKIPSDGQEIRRAIYENGFIRDFNWRIKRRDGVERICNLTASAWKNDHGEVIAHLSIARDITDAKHLEEQLVRSQKMEAVGTLAGGIAHDFNNLLHVIMGYADMAMMDVREGDPGYRAFKQIKDASRSAAELTEGLLTFSRRVESQLRPVDMNRELEHVVEMLRRTIPKMIAIELKTDENLGRVNADPAQLQQVLMNLCLNARDAMPGGGRLLIETSSVTLDATDCAYHPEMAQGKYLLLSVSDTGCGIEAKSVQQVFDPFYTTKDVGKGTGLGLAIVYGIVKNHGGTIVCRSEPQKGTSFWIYLPAIESNQEQYPNHGTESPVGGNETILLVEDEESVRRLGEQILSRFGYSVISAADGRQAVATFAENRNTISLVILDLIMPDMGGRQCLREILKIDPSAKVLIASGYAADGEMDDAIVEGARASIRKPYEAVELLGMVRKILDPEEP